MPEFHNSQGIEYLEQCMSNLSNAEGPVAMLGNVQRFVENKGCRVEEQRTEPSSGRCKAAPVLRLRVRPRSIETTLRRSLNNGDTYLCMR